jgi:DNA invertase Pin-like site-specific DNA recombinase
MQKRQTEKPRHYAVVQKQRMLTESERDEAIIKYADGMTMKAVATDYGCHRTTIRNILRARGVVIRR